MGKVLQLKVISFPNPKTFPVLSDGGKAYLDQNPKLDSLIRSLVEEASEDVGENGGETESVECRSRDGFIAYAHNCGGYEYKAFDYVSCGVSYSNKEANAQVNKTLENAKKEGLKQLGLPEGTNHNSLTEEQQEELTEFEENYLQDETIKLDLRVMYSGVENDKHVAWVSACINWEAPYHRSHISWMPNMKCETAKEVKVTFKNLREAKTKIRAALAKVKKIF
jgi:hypothetical protein